MGISLQDQLKALGLAKGKPKQARNMPRPRQQENTGELSLEKAFALRKQDEKHKAAKAKQKKQEEDRQRKKLNNAIREIVKTHRLNQLDAQIARNFMFRGRIRKIHVTPDQLKALNAGELGIAYLSGGYHLLPAEQAEAVRLLSAEHVVVLTDDTQDDDGDFPIPDDVTW
jgi:uncharacterized protein YaiL (DUF2058 family)